MANGSSPGFAADLHARRRTNAALERTPPRAARTPTVGRLTDANSASLHKQMVPLRSLRLTAGAPRPGSHRSNAPDSTGSFATKCNFGSLGPEMRPKWSIRISCGPSSPFPQRALTVPRGMRAVKDTTSACGVLDSPHTARNSRTLVLWGKTAQHSFALQNGPV